MRSGMVVVRLEGRLLGLCEAELCSDCTVIFRRASPASMRKDFDGEEWRGPGVPEKWEWVGGATLRRRVKVWAEMGDEGRCRGSGEEPEREDIVL